MRKDQLRTHDPARLLQFRMIDLAHPIPEVQMDAPTQAIAPGGRGTHPPGAGRLEPILDLLIGPGMKCRAQVREVSLLTGAICQWA